MMIRDTLSLHLEPVGETFLQASTYLLVHHRCSCPLSTHVVREDVETLRHGTLQLGSFRYNVQQTAYAGDSAPHKQSTLQVADVEIKRV